MENVVHLVNQYGFPIVAAFGMAGLIFYVWKWVTSEIKPLLSEAEELCIKLIDRIRMLDNDIIRLNQKVETVLQLKSKLVERDRLLKKLEEKDK
jgi:hypothetical protein